MQFYGKVRPKVSQVLGLGVLSALLLIVACGGAAAPAPSPAPVVVEKEGEKIVVANPTPIAAPVRAAGEVHPGKVTWLVGSFANERMDYCLAGGGGHDYGRLIHEFLIMSGDVEGARKLEPGIATEWSVSADGTAWTFTVREGVKFHDGTELTVDDVYWSIQHATNPEVPEYATGGGCLSESGLIDRVEKTGPNQITSYYKGPYLYWDSYWSDATGVWIGVVYPKRDKFHDEAAELAFDRNPVGAGKFRLVDHVASDKMVFERFDDYFYQPANGFAEDRRPRFSTFDLRLVPEVSTRIAAVRSGQADVAPVTLAAKGQIEAGGGRLVFGKEGSFFIARLLGCWEEQYPCHDLRVRQALNYTVDRISMRDKLFGGPEVMEVKGWTYITPSTLGYTPELDPFPFDPDKGRELLAAAGYPGGEGFGKLIIHTWPSTAIPNMPEAAQFVAQIWRQELGIDAEVRTSEEAAIKKLTRLTEDAYGQVLFRDNETEIDGAKLLDGNYGRSPDRPDRVSRDPDIVALAQRTRVISGPGREKALNEAYLKMREDSGELMMGYVNTPWGVGPRILTWEPLPLAFYATGLHTITLAD